MPAASTASGRGPLIASDSPVAATASVAIAG